MAVLGDTFQLAGMDIVRNSWLVNIIERKLFELEEGNVDQLKY